MTAGTVPLEQPATSAAGPTPPALPTQQRRARPTSQSATGAGNGRLPLTTARSGYLAESVSQGHRAIRKLSPGLLARMKLLDAQKENRLVTGQIPGQDKVGRIPESQLRELEGQHKVQALKVERRGRAWKGLAKSEAAQEACGSAPMEAQFGDSDQSSIISTSDRPAPSDSDSSEVMDVADADTQKYRLPDIGKIRLTSANTGQENKEHADDDRPPTPPPKDSPSIDETSAERNQSGDDSGDGESYFRTYSLSRANSVYSLSRVSFTNQLSQLTSIKLPQASSLASSISAIPTSTGAARALTDAAEQIRRWIHKASEVLTGLDAEDDVEWAAAGGREGLGDVDSAITRFESLIDVYVTAIDELQMREDIGNLQAQDLERGVDQMEGILKDWQGVKQTLQGVKEQVEIAMEWEELWNTVLGEIGAELEALGRMVFEMEERRHRAFVPDTAAGSSGGFDIVELETIMEETPNNASRAHAGNRFSLPPAFPMGSPLQSPNAETANAESNLLGLFARMQPLRASLDFLPMRLSVFHSRGNPVFPTACEELERRRDSLEEQWKKLEADAEALRRELSEDRWVLVFRNAGRQALKMCESVTRSLVKLHEALDENGQHTNLPATAKKIESYEAKKMHYGPAIERVLSIIDKGVKDRLTVNGEVLRLQSDMKKKWADLQTEMKEADEVLEELNLNRSQQLRDSISTILSTDRSVTSSALDTPGSSPASSVVVMSRKNSDNGSTTTYGNGLSRSGSFRDGSNLTSSASKRHSSMPAALSNIPRRGTLPRPNTSESVATATSPSASRAGSSTPKPSRVQRLSMNTVERPRWNPCTNLAGTVIGHNFKPVSATTPSGHQRAVPPARAASYGSPHSSLPVPSPLSRSSAFWSPPPGSPQPSPLAAPQSPPVFTAPAGRALQNPTTPLRGFTPAPRLRAPASASNLAASAASRRQSSFIGSREPAPAAAEESPSNRPKPSRPASALASGRRSSMLPRRMASGAGTESRAGMRGVNQGEERPRWRP